MRQLSRKLKIFQLKVQLGQRDAEIQALAEENAALTVELEKALVLLREAGVKI